ncbi:metallophosphoesterase [Chitinophagaceae bacterium MMS25-I14]
MQNKMIHLVCSAVMATACFLFSGCSSSKTAHTNTAGKNKFYFLFLSDVHLATDSTRSVYGQDAGTDLWNAFKIKIDSVLKSSNPPAFILYTGDMPEHGGNYHPDQRNMNIDSLLTDLHRMAAIRSIPLFYLPGNNDALGGNYCFFSDEHGETPFSLVPGYFPYPYQAFNVAKTPVAKKGAYMISGTNLAAGYYAARVMKGLRMISLNSVLWSSQLCNNCVVAGNCTDQQAAGTKQMAWLQQQLADAAAAGDKVYLAMHIPPGADAYMSRNNPANPTMMWGDTQDKYGWQNAFLHMTAQYRQTIAGIFYGHTHMDEFRLLYADSAAAAFTQVAISCPGISPRSGNNPGFKLVFADPQSKSPTDFITYYSTVNPVVWQQPYMFSKLKGVKPGLSIYDALKQMTARERTNALDTIYNVKHGTVPYDTLGLNVKWGR